MWTFDFPARQALFLAYKEQCLQKTLFVQTLSPEKRSSLPEGEKLRRAAYLV